MSISVPLAPAQDRCDFNQNGFADMADLARLINMINHFSSPDSVEYWPDADCDCDTVHLTISDLLGMNYRMIYGYGWGTGLLIDSDIDTLSLPAIVASPGQLLEIPILLSTVRDLNGIQFYVTYDTDLISILDFSWNDTVDNGQSPYIAENGFASYNLQWLPRGFASPIGLLSVQINADAVPQETRIDFADDPYLAAYTGLSASDSTAEPPDPRVQFIRPVKINGVINIIQTAVEGQEVELFERLTLNIRSNPSNLSFIIEFSLPTLSHVALYIYAITGQRVARLVDETLSPGNHEIVWQPQNLASGLYFARLTTEYAEISAKLTLLK
jgi:hypothetical protein